YVYQFNRTTGKRMKAFKLPDYFAVTHLRAFEKGPDGEIAVNTVGRTTNKGMEGLAITSNGKTLVGSMQTQLLQDEKKYVRIVTINIETGATHEYAYLLTDGSGVSEIVAINNHEFLVDERDGKGLGDGSSAVVKKLFKIDLTGAADISGTVSIGTGTPTVAKTLFLDVVAELTANGISATNIPAKIEGVAFGPDILIEGANKHTLFVANDNDFLATVNGVNNPNQFFVFSIDESDLPTFLQQNVAPFVLDDHDRG
ncbi:MAG: esterase-like activity of phytase family protein, partial [Methylococcales bacterium]